MPRILYFKNLELIQLRNGMTKIFMENVKLYPMAYSVSQGTQNKFINLFQTSPRIPTPPLSTRCMKNA